MSARVQNTLKAKTFRPDAWANKFTESIFKYFISLNLCNTL